MQEMQRLEIDVLGLSEVRGTNTGSFDKQGYHIIWSGGQKHEQLNMALVLFLIARAKSCTRIIWLFQIESFYSS